MPASCPPPGGFRVILIAPWLVAASLISCFSFYRPLTCVSKHFSAETKGLAKQLRGRRVYIGSLLLQDFPCPIYWGIGGPVIGQERGGRARSWEGTEVAGGLRNQDGFGPGPV